MPSDHVTGDGESETGTARVPAPGLVEADEPLEDPLPVLRSDTGPVVADGEDDVVALHGHGHRDGARRVPLRIVASVRPCRGNGGRGGDAAVDNQVAVGNGI